MNYVIYMTVMHSQWKSEKVAELICVRDYWVTHIRDYSRPFSD